MYRMVPPASIPRVHRRTGYSRYGRTHRRDIPGWSAPLIVRRALVPFTRKSTRIMSGRMRPAHRQKAYVIFPRMYRQIVAVMEEINWRAHLHTHGGQPGTPPDRKTLCGTQQKGASHGRTDRRDRLARRALDRRGRAPRAPRPEDHFAHTPLNHSRRMRYFNAGATSNGPECVRRDRVLILSRMLFLH